MSRSRRKKKKHKRVTFHRLDSYNQDVNQGPQGPPPCYQGRHPPAAPSVVGHCDEKDYKGPVAPTPQFRPDAPVPVYAGDPAVYLYSIPQWEARKYLNLGLVKPMLTKRRIKGVLVADVKEAQAIQARDWSSGGLATLDQVQGLPVAGPAITLFYGKPCKKAA